MQGIFYYQRVKEVMNFYNLTESDVDKEYICQNVCDMLHKKRRIYYQSVKDVMNFYNLSGSDVDKEYICHKVYFLRGGRRG
jgi:putative transposon-encoded protein